MARWFNIGGPCIAADHYMLPAAERLPEVMSHIRKGALESAAFHARKSVTFSRLVRNQHVSTISMAPFATTELATLRSAGFLTA